MSPVWYFIAGWCSGLVVLGFIIAFAPQAQRMSAACPVGWHSTAREHPGLGHHFTRTFESTKARHLNSS